MIRKAPKMHHGILLLFFLTFIMYSCSKDTSLLVDPETEIALEEEKDVEPESPTEETPSEEETPPMEEEEEEEEETPPVEEEEEEPDTEGSNCSNPSDFIFNENDGLVSVEFEEAAFSGSWKLKSDGNGYSGDGYMVWEGSQYFHHPGTGTVTFKVKIENPGAYRFIWKSGIKMGNDGTEHNDTWLRFSDADDFYGQKSGGSSKVYPVGSGKTPNPKGASKDGWLKIYRSGNNLDFKWESKTSDHDGYQVFVKFNNPGTYVMEVSARSSGHAIDKFVLFNSSWSEADAISNSELSVISCN